MARLSLHLFTPTPRTSDIAAAMHRFGGTATVERYVESTITAEHMQNY